MVYKVSLRSTLAISTSVCALVIGNGAAAADASAAPAEAAAPSTTVDVIVVTAQRREETANKIGMGIQAFRGEQLSQLHVTNVKDLASVAPSFSVSQSYQGVPTYTLRGIGFNTINMSATSTVGTYVDEVAYAYPMMNTGPMFDVQRVEVLKGPQGTLYGRNTTAGLIDLVTNKPTRDFQASGTAEVGNYGTHNFEGYVSGPITDKLQGRLSFRTDDSDEGWQRSNTRGDKLGEVHRYGLRASLAYQPNEQTNIDLSYNGWRNESDTVAAQGIGFTPATAASPFNAPGLVNYIATHAPTSATQADWESASARSANIGTGLGIASPLKENDTFHAFKLRVGYDLPGGVRMVSLTNYNQLKRNATFDWSGAPYEILVQHAQGDIRSFGEELHFEGKTGPANWLVGGYYGHDNIVDANRTMLGQNSNVGTIRYLTNSLLATPFNVNGYTALDASQAFRTYRDQGLITTSTSSIFANADWTLTDALKLTTGVRYTRDLQNFVGGSLDFNGNMLPNVNTTNRYLYYAIYGKLSAPITQGQFVSFDPATGLFGPASSKLDEDNVSWRTALNWSVTRDIIVYGSVSRGAKAGATPINAANIVSQDAPAHQELLVAYETGVKAALFERRVQFNASVFYYDYKNKQLSVYFADPIYTALSRLQNIPKADAYGLDGDVTWRVTPNLTAIGAATWLHTEVNGYVGTNSAGQSQNFDGAPFLYSPQFQGSLTLLYKREITPKLGLQAALNGRFQSNSHSDLEGNPLFAIPSYGLLNASIGLHDENDKWEVSIWARNLTDEYYWTAVSSNANVVVRFPGQPQTFGASFTVKY